jgi:predicted  nucleic acid-binding Zn-ribbon protein
LYNAGLGIKRFQIIQQDGTAAAVNTMANSDDIRNVLERINSIQKTLEELTGRLRRGPILLKIQENNICKQQDKLDKANEELQRLKSAAKQKELEAAASDQALAKRKQQLLESKSNKEYSALQMQIKADEQARSVLDDEAFEVIEKAEKFAETLPPLETELKKLQDVFNATKEKFLKEKPGIEGQIAEYAADLHQEEVKLPREFHEVYDRLVRSTGGAESLAVVAGQKFCGGCNQQVPINSLAQIMAKKPVQCSSCARLLYLPPDFEFDKG